MKYQSIDELVADDLKWRKLAKNFLKCEMLADDFVQDFYMSYMNLPKGQSIDEHYVSVSIYHYKIKKYYQNQKTTSYNDELEYNLNEYDYDEDERKEKLIDKVQQVLTTLDWFHRTVWTYHRIDGIKMRQLARDTGIHYNIIQSTIKYVDKHLKNKFNNGKETN